MKRRFDPHDGYRVLWLVLHGTGVVVTGTVGGRSWGVYFALVALLEGIAVVRALQGRTASGTWSWVTWRFLLDGGRDRYPWRIALVAAWSVWFVVGFALHGWFATWLNAVIAHGFLFWLWRHFFGLRAKGARSESAPDQAPKNGRR